MELHFVGMANGCVYYPYWKKARLAPAHYVHGNVAHRVDGISTARLNCPHTSMLSPLNGLFANVGQKSNGATAEF